MAAYESTLHVFKEAHLYKIPARSSSKGYKYALCRRAPRARTRSGPQRARPRVRVWVSERTTGPPTGT